MEEGTAAAGHAFFFLTQPELRFLDAALARLIPADELGPGAKEADVSCFIDRQLASAWGTHSRNYRMGPWQEGKPEQGFQSRLTPQEIYRAAIRETNIHCGKTYGRTFNALKAEQQDEVLHALEQGRIELESLSSRLFFDMLLKNTEEGFFADPMYGGNRNKVSWKLVGFPGLPALYTKLIVTYRDKRYAPEPKSIADFS